MRRLLTFLIVLSASLGVGHAEYAAHATQEFNPCDIYEYIGEYECPPPTTTTVLPTTTLPAPARSTTTTVQSYTSPPPTVTAPAAPAPPAAPSSAPELPHTGITLIPFVLAGTIGLLIGLAFIAVALGRQGSRP